MVAAARCAEMRGLCDVSVGDAIEVTLEAVGLPTGSPHLADDALLLKAMAMDKKVQGGRVRLVLPVRMGEVVIVGDATAEEVVAAWGRVR